MRYVEAFSAVLYIAPRAVPERRGIDCARRVDAVAGMQ